MDFSMEVGIFLTYAAGLMVIYLLGKFLLVPIKIILKLVLNSIIGGVILLLLNVFGSGIGISLPINLLTAAIAGILGVPGIIGIIVYFNVL